MAQGRATPGGKAGVPTGDVPAPILRVVLRAVRDAEVLCLAFPRIERALVIDPRPGDGDHPTARVVPLVFGTAGLAAAVAALRPGMPPSERAIAATWGGSTRAFAAQGALAAIVARLPPEREAGVLAAFEELCAAEGGSAPPPPGDPVGEPPDR